MSELDFSGEQSRPVRRAHRAASPAGCDPFRAGFWGAFGVMAALFIVNVLLGVVYLAVLLLIRAGH